VRGADWGGPADVKASLRHASIVGSDRVVFNIGGNRYRLVARIDYPHRVVYIRFIGSHAEYEDRCDEGLMEIRPIKTEADYDEALAEIDRLMGSPPGSPLGDRLEVLVTLVEAYEEARHPIGSPTALAAMEFQMEQRGMSVADLDKMLAGAMTAKAVLSGAPLNLEAIRRLRDGLEIPADILIGATAAAAAE
jgi:HTH-type transcriptional regulator / antitoxin HigA